MTEQALPASNLLGMSDVIADRNCMTSETLYKAALRFRDMALKAETDVEIVHFTALSVAMSNLWKKSI